MVKGRMDLLELLHKGGMDGDVDFLREALRVLVEGIMDAEVSSRIGGFMDRPLDGGPYPYLWLDALTQKVRGSLRSSYLKGSLRQCRNAWLPKRLGGMEKAPVI